jgi:hypothetical protein
MAWWPFHFHTCKHEPLIQIKQERVQDPEIARRPGGIRIWRPRRRSRPAAGLHRCCSIQIQWSSLQGGDRPAPNGFDPSRVRRPTSDPDVICLASLAMHQLDIVHCTLTSFSARRQCRAWAAGPWALRTYTCTSSYSVDSYGSSSGSDW